MGLGIDISSTGGAGTPGILKVSDEVARLLLSPSPGDWVVQTDDGTLWYYNGTNWELRSKVDPILEVRDSNSVALTTEVTVPPYDDDIPSHDTKVYATLKLSVAAPDVNNLEVTRDIQLDGLRTQIPVSSVRSVLSATAPVAYDNTTGVISMAQATNANDGYMDSTHVAALEGVIADLNSHLSNTTDAHDASAISASGTYSDVQSAINGMEIATAAVATDLANHLSDAVDAHDASAISYVNTTSGLTATTAQAAIDEVDQKIDDHIADLSAAHPAGAVSFTPPTNYSSTDVQAAILEIAKWKFPTAVVSDVPASAGTLTSYRRQIFRVQGSTGPLLNLVVTSTALVDGDEVIIMGTDDANYVTLSSTNLITNGSVTLGQNETISFVKLGTNLIEIARSN